MYVVGFLGHDGELGRTFLCQTLEQSVALVNTIIEDHEDSKPDEDHWDDDCTWHTSMGTYFLGGLEEPGEL